MDGQIPVIERGMAGMMRHNRRQRRSRGTKTMSGTLFAVALFALSACSSPDRAVGAKELRKLGDSGKAVQARQQTEKRLRDVAQAYGDRAPLSLGLVVVHDTCEPGSGPGWFFQNQTDDYKIACSMSITAYYGADPHHMGNVLDKILTAGDPIRFTPNNFGRRLVAYYRGQGPNPNGPHAEEPTQLVASEQTLTWDTLRDLHRPVEEPYGGLVNDPPLSRVLREPESATVAGIRKRYGMVFKLELISRDYYKVLKSGQTNTN